MRLFIPKLIYESVQSIDLDRLKSLNIKGIVLDTDNTLIDYKKNMPDGIKEWVDFAKKEGFKVCILSNSNKIPKIKAVAEKLSIEYINSAKKPMKQGFIKSIKLLDLKAAEVAMVGDQLFTDVLGANIMGMLSIYVEPISKKEYWYTSWKRPIEAFILKRSCIR